MEKLLYKKTIINLLVGIVFILAILCLRLLFDQWQSYNKGVESLNGKDYKAAIMYFDRTLCAHIPFSPLEQKAKASLLSLGANFEQEKEPEMALLCYETVRSSRYLSRHLWVPDRDEIPFLNDKIASVKAGLLLQDGMVKDFKEGYDQQMGIMNKDYSPSVLWSVIAVVSLGIYISGIVLWIVKRDKLYMIVFFTSFFIWITSLYVA